MQLLILVVDVSVVNNPDFSVHIIFRLVIAFVLLRKAPLMAKYHFHSIMSSRQNLLRVVPLPALESLFQ